MFSIIAVTKRERLLENVFNNYERQRYKEKELIIILNDDAMDIDRWQKKAQEIENVRVFQLESSITLGECYNFAIPKAKYDYIAKFDDDDYYSSYYLEEAMKGLQVSGADLVGKSTVFIYYLSNQMLTLFNEKKEFTELCLEEELYKKYLLGATFVFKKEIFLDVTFEKVNVGEDTLFLKACLRKGFKLYSTSKYNYVYIRYPNIRHHTSTFQEYKLFQKSTVLRRINNFKEYIEYDSKDIFK
ncbi:glycosyltransferase family A protein [Bacillus sp. DX1.1]|uniref:glycosyltransferase n=1 Tax=unclassified Bacillus (in: firmicutes) TaxID=185979 RepID=UPI002570CA98|nr:MULTISPECIES: glycosyltransferase family A protein [unclassified Bacillus (in: firmicutes)]MDM5153861.1 glycosyltransferase family A protein [Bacillus sp. DX1.1]WJE82796.1 glycosyltransferase family A protein [Bacillus sp. DX3.1]